MPGRSGRPGRCAAAAGRSRPSGREPGQRHGIAAWSSGRSARSLTVKTRPPSPANGSSAGAAAPAAGSIPNACSSASARSAATIALKRSIRSRSASERTSCSGSAPRARPASRRASAADCAVATAPAERQPLGPPRRRAGQGRMAGGAPPRRGRTISRTIGRPSRRRGGGRRHCPPRPAEAIRGRSCSSLAPDAEQLLDHVVGDADHLRGGLEAALDQDQVAELLREVDVRRLDLARRKRCRCRPGGCRAGGCRRRRESRNMPAPTRSSRSGSRTSAIATAADRLGLLVRIGHLPAGRCHRP